MKLRAKTLCLIFLTSFFILFTSYFLSAILLKLLLLNVNVGNLAASRKSSFIKCSSRCAFSVSIDLISPVNSTTASEKSSFEDSMFDLIIVAQAVHWFNFEKFYNEVKRTLKPEGIIAVIGYTLPKIDDEVDEILDGLLEQAVNGDREAQEFLQMFGPFAASVLPGQSCATIVA